MTQREVLGIGSALVDLTYHVEDSFLVEEGLPKGGMTLVSREQSNQLINKLIDIPVTTSPGGASANVISSNASCGGVASFLGKVGKDSNGEFFQVETEKVGAEYLSLSSDTETGVVITLITKDRQRTFATCLGAAIELCDLDMKEEYFSPFKIIHIEAYLVFNEPLLRAILSMAKDLNKKVSLDLSAYTVIEESRPLFLEILEEYVDIVFANEDEARAISQIDDPRKALDFLTQYCDIVIVKVGGEGSYLAEKGEIVFVPPFKVDAVDTNGAGDAYAGGVLYGVSKGLSLMDSGLIGSKAGALVVSQEGARLCPKNELELKSFVSEVWLKQC